MLKTPSLAAFLLTACTVAQADPGYYLVSVYENEGQTNLDYRYWTFRAPGEGETIWPEIGVGYGVTKRWYTELLASYIGDDASNLKLSNLTWQNDYLLTQGQYDFDLALHTLLVRTYGPDGSYALEFGPALQTDFGRVQVNTNLVFEKVFDDTLAQPVQLKYQWQAKYRWKPGFQFGLQGFGELGDWNNWAPREHQSHRAGPMVSGTIKTSGTQAFKYEASYLFGSTYGTPGNMFSMRLQFVF
jgi:hypothetical protein